MPLPISTIILAFAVTISLAENSILYGLVPFLLAFLLEVGRSIAARSEAVELEEAMKI